MKGYGKGGGKGFDGGKGGGGGKGFDGGKGGKGGFDGGKGKGKGPPKARFNAANVKYVGPPTFNKECLPEKFLGPVNWSGKESERAEEGEEVSGEFHCGRMIKGTLGDKFDVVCNMSPIDLTSQQRHMYRVDFSPEVELRRRRGYLVREALKDIGMPIAYDGDHLVYTSALINNNKKEIMQPVQLSLGGTETETIHVKLNWTSHQTAKLSKQTIMFFCTRFKAAMGAQKERICIGSDYFDLSQAEQIPDYNCQLAPGLDCTIYTSQCGPIINTDLMFKHIRTDTVWDLMQQMQRRNANEEAINMAFSHKVVMPSYSDPKRSIIIDRVRFDMSPQLTFDAKGVKTTYADYIRKKYGITNHDLNKKQPLLESVSRKERDRDGNLKVSHFIPSLCHLTGATDEMKADTMRGRALIRKTAMPPHERISKIQSSVTQMLNNKDFSDVLQPWGIKMTSDLLRVPARRLPTPAMRNAQSSIQIRPDAESWDIKFQWPQYRASNFKNWAILCHQQNQEVRTFVDMLFRVGKDLNVNLEQPKIYDTAGDFRPRAYMDCLKQQVAKQQPTFLLVVVPRNTDEPYKSVKNFLGSKDVGIPSQFVTAQNISKDPLLKATKVLVQMNCKNGGAPWTADAKFAGPTMIVGCDVHHGGDLEHKGGSVAAFVANTDKECTRYYSRTFVVKPRQQILQPISTDQPGLKKLTMDAIEAFKKTNNKTPPAQIIVYRDGGSEGELQSIDKYEVKQIREAIKEAGLKDCKLTFFVVLKKIRARYFQINPANDQEVANPPPGTVVDTHIVNNYIPEFFLCCQHVNQGSATPTKYQKIYDDSSLDANTLQMYTYCQSHMYFNWNGTIRTPAVLKYASTLAKFSGQTMKGRDVSPKLHDRLHYL